MHAVRHDRRTVRALAALAWLAGGTLLALLTPLRTPSAALGWSGPFWLLAAPALVLLVLAPRLPLRLLARLLARR